MAYRDRHRPSWQSDVCPSWCARQHTEADHPDDRRHQDEGRVLAGVVLRQDTPADQRIAEPSELIISISCAVNDEDVWIYIGEGERRERHLHLSHETAQRLSGALRDALSSLAA